MRCKAFGATCMALVMVVLSAVAPAVGQAAPQPDAASSGPRVRLDLQPPQQEALKATMREHLVVLEAIVSALARQDYNTAASVAHLELGFPKHHDAMLREGGASLPKHYQELAMAHHQAAEELAGAIAAKQMAPILRQLSKTIQACTACHNAYRL
jgi:Cytochrome C'